MNRRQFIQSSGVIGLAALAPRLRAAEEPRDPLMAKLIVVNDEFVGRELARQEHATVTAGSAESRMRMGFIARIPRRSSSAPWSARGDAASRAIANPPNWSRRLKRRVVTFWPPSIRMGRSTWFRRIFIQRRVRLSFSIILRPRSRLLRLAKWAPANPLLLNPEKFTRNAAEALTAADVHTRNHRWVV